MIERVSPAGVPSPRGPYSPAVKAGGFIYVSGQISVDPVTDKAHLSDIATETRQVLKNIETNVADFAAMNAVYAEFFGNAKPARTTIGVASLPLAGAKVEIDAIAYKP